MIALLAASRVDAQCTDGSAPPCRQPTVARSVPVDPNRVAVLPFRITTADSLLGEGFAELLAPEFTGEGGPRAIDMSTVLSAWRGAGGGLRTPVSQEVGMRLARQLGAGLLCQGSIVGSGGRLIVSASLVDATSGKAIGNPARATGTADSMETMLGQVYTGLLGAGSRDRVRESARLTKSPAAYRAYFEGLSLLRRGRWGPAEQALEASIAADSTFASAIYQRWFIAASSLGAGIWMQRVLAVRDRLTPRERAVVEGVYGVDPTKTRTGREVYTDRLRGAERLVDSPEAWFFFADFVYHNGVRYVGGDSVLPIARMAFERAVGIDTQPPFLYHLSEIALHTRDTALARRLLPAYERLEGEERWARGWGIAAFLRDGPTLARLRQTGPDRNPTFISALSLAMMLDTPIPAAVADEAFRRLRDAGDMDVRDLAAAMAWVVQSARGRPTAAEQSIAGHYARLWRMPFIVWLWVSGDTAQDAAFMRAHGAASLADSVSENRRQCAQARMIAEQGHADSVDFGLLRRRGMTRCARILEGLAAFAAHTLTDSALAELDTLIGTVNYASFVGFEHRMLARIYESRGDTSRALRAIRLYPRDYTGVSTAPTFREEGRYYLMARDTANAIRSYNHYLELRADAEPPYVAERDSIKALVATLARRK